MKLYLLSQNQNDGYDTYDSVVVAAETEDEARLIHPGGNEWDSECGCRWAKSPAAVSVELIGVAVDGTKPGVVLASFNAG